MRFFGYRFALAVLSLIGSGTLVATPSQAQATRTWVSGVGDDANPCSRTAPCKTFAGSISKTAAGGEINCLDPGGYGQVTITKSISIICEGVLAGILASAGNGVNIVAGVNDVVVLKGLDIEGFGSANAGIRFASGRALYVSNTRINNFTGAYAITFEPSGASALNVDNVQVTRNGSAITTTGGIQIKPTSTGSAVATISNSVIANNMNTGIRVDSTGVTGSSSAVTVVNTVVVNSGVGVLAKAPAGTGTVAVSLKGVTLSHNTTNGIIANGTGTTGLISNSIITRNATGVTVAGGAVLTSFGDNQLSGNTTNGAFSGTTPPQ